MNPSTVDTGTVEQVLFMNNLQPLETIEFLRVRVTKLEKENEHLEQALSNANWKLSQIAAIVAQYTFSTGHTIPIDNDILNQEDWIAVVRAFQTNKLTLSIDNDTFGLTFYITTNQNPLGNRESIPCEKAAFFERLRELYGIVPMPVHAHAE